MATGVVGQPISETFDLAVAGLTFTRLSSRIGQASVTWSPTFTDLANGDYEYRYTPSAAGAHSWNGVASNGRKVTINFTVLTAAQADPAAALAATVAQVATIAGRVDVAVSTRATPAQYFATSPSPTVSGGTIWTRDDPEVD